MNFRYSYDTIGRGNLVLLNIIDFELGIVYLLYRTIIHVFTGILSRKMRIALNVDVYCVMYDMI